MNRTRWLALMSEIAILQQLTIQDASSSPNRKQFCLIDAPIAEEHNFARIGYLPSSSRVHAANFLNGLDLILLLGFRL
jgi:hypothetical protein